MRLRLIALPLRAHRSSVPHQWFAQQHGNNPHDRLRTTPGCFGAESLDGCIGFLQNGLATLLSLRARLTVEFRDSPFSLGPNLLNGVVTLDLRLTQKFFPSCLQLNCGPLPGFLGFQQWNGLSLPERLR